MFAKRVAAPVKMNISKKTASIKKKKVFHVVKVLLGFYYSEEIVKLKSIQPLQEEITEKLIVGVLLSFLKHQDYCLTVCKLHRVT